VREVPTGPIEREAIRYESWRRWGGVGELDSKGVEAIEISCIGSSLSSPIVTCLIYDSHVQQ
jgi:hypothetical protein